MLLGEALGALKQEMGEKYSHWVDVWFGCIGFESFDPATQTLILQLPSEYVFEFLQSNGWKYMLFMLRHIFKEDAERVTLKYRVVKPRQEVEIQQLMALAARKGFNTAVGFPQVRVADAERHMRECLQHIVGDTYQWQPDYDKVAEWLTDNRGKGLVIVGMPGTGKSVLATRVLPLLIGFESVAVCSAVEMTAHNGKMARIDELLQADCIIIDGLGAEDVEVNHYGRHRRPFYELCDAVEQQGKLLIATTNCISTFPMPDTWAGKRLFPSSFEERYGRDTFSRLRAIAQSVIFNGRDMRK